MNLENLASAEGELGHLLWQEVGDGEGLEVKGLQVLARDLVRGRV